ncbi:MAG: hypothetical protein N2510_04125 [Ignavibacteria bacterium]|nr:hypothetical protein [Ignavibacteria bacterium]
MTHKNSSLAVLIIIYLLQGCGIFDTRDAEIPNMTRSTYVPPTTPDLVITNLEYSILEKNSDNYFKCLSDGFKYIPDSKSQLLYGHIFVSWNSLSERRYIDNLINTTNTNSTSILFLDNRRLTLISPDSAIFQSDYTLVFQHRRNDVPKSSRGSLNLFLGADENRLFSINRWEDFRFNDTDFTWSEMRAKFSNE